MPGGLNRRQFEDALKSKVDIVIPDLPKPVGQAATLGKPAASVRGPFQAAIKDLGNAGGGEPAAGRDGGGRWSSGRAKKGGLGRLFGKK